jgi:hypothetical protein
MRVSMSRRAFTAALLVLASWTATEAASGGGIPSFVASCPVSSQPSPRLPDRLVQSAGRRWVGQEGLYVRTQGRAYGGFWMPKERAYHFKIAWYRASDGRITVVGRRRGGHNRTKLEIRGTWSSYPAPGIAPSTLIFARPGCWDITARLNASAVSFTLAVYDTPRR